MSKNVLSWGWVIVHAHLTSPPRAEPNTLLFLLPFGRSNFL